jgi:hypothetical protein
MTAGWRRFGIFMAFGMRNGKAPVSGDRYTPAMQATIDR